jgi:hypothetical protein
MNKSSIAAAAILAVTLGGSAVLASAEAATPSARPTAHATAKAGAFTVTANVNKTEPLAGSKVKVKGSVKPAAPGAKVVLQLRYAGQKKWKSVGTDRLSATGRFRFKDKISSVRERKYRVVKPAGRQRAAGHSKSLKVTVFGWRDLTSIRVATANGMGTTDSVSINGVAFPQSIQSYSFTYPPGSGHSIEFNLNRSCKAFRGTVGLADTSQGGGSATVQLSTDGVSRYSGSFALTQSAPVAFDVTKVFRLSVTAAPANGGVAAVGTPQVLCSF